MRCWAVLVLLTLAGCSAVHLGTDPAELERTWQQGWIFTPGTPFASNTSIRNREHMAKLVQRLAGRRLPTVIYAHGCAGIDPSSWTDGETLARAGYLVVMPDSFGRQHKPASCDGGSLTGGFHRAVISWRIAEIDYATKRASELSFVDATRLALVGYSEGGMTAALHPGGPFRARVILGWTCNAANPEWQGIAAPREQAVLAVVSRGDPWFTVPGLRGDCGGALAGRPNARSIVLESTRHHVLSFPEVQQAVREFLGTHLGPAR